MADTRKKLTTRQFEIYKQCVDSLTAAQRDFELSRDRFNTAAALILDAHGVSPEAHARIDDTTGELVIPESTVPLS